MDGSNASLGKKKKKTRFHHRRSPLILQLWTSWGKKKLVMHNTLCRDFLPTGTFTHCRQCEGQDEVFFFSPVDVAWKSSVHTREPGLRSRFPIDFEGRAPTYGEVKIQSMG